MSRAVILSASSTTPLASLASFQSSAEAINAYNYVTCSVFTDKDALLYVETSINGTDWDESVSFAVLANVSTSESVKLNRLFYRVKLTNSSGVAQTFLRLQTITSVDVLLGSASGVATDVNITNSSIAVTGSFLTNVEIRATPLEVTGVIDIDPTGLASDSNQVLEITKLTSIDNKLSGPLDIPLTTDYYSDITVGSVQTIIYKNGGSGGTTLKTITITYSGDNSSGVIS